jgi:hypothetical protein
VSILREGCPWRTWPNRVLVSFALAFSRILGPAFRSRCFWTSVLGLVAPILGLTFIDINPHVQTVIMWLFAAVAVVALFFDRRQHGENAPVVIGAAALIVIVGTLYTFYDSATLACGYVLLLMVVSRGWWKLVEAA